MCKFSKCFGGISGSLIGGLTLLALIALGLGIYTSHHTNNTGNDKNEKSILTNLQQNLVSATVFPQPREIDSFSLIDNEGKPFTNKNLEGHWTLLFFGFTHCQNICPTTLTLFNKIYKEFEARKLTEPQFMMVSIDPERDDIKRINQYVKSFNSAFTAATGTKETLDKMTQNMSVLYMKIMQGKGDKNEDYTIDHSGTIILIGPNAKVVAVFPMPHDAENISKDYTTITSAWTQA